MGAQSPDLLKNAEARLEVSGSTLRHLEVDREKPTVPDGQMQQM